jgi:hypothetical protein
MWWRIYYGEGVFTDADGSPFDAPRVDVQVIVQEKDGDYELIHGKDYFYWEPKRGGWHATDLFGAFDHLIRAERQCLLVGRMLADDEWATLWSRVKQDCGPRTGRYARESLREPYL